MPKRLVPVMGLALCAVFGLALCAMLARTAAAAPVPTGADPAPVLENQAGTTTPAVPLPSVSGPLVVRPPYPEAGAVAKLVPEPAAVRPTAAQPTAAQPSAGPDPRPVAPLLPTGPRLGDATYLAELVQTAKALRLAEHPQWWALMHYRRHWFGRVESEADGAGFFFAADGKTDPDAELAATLAHFFDPARPPPVEPDEIGGVETRHPQCKFPARFAWLDARLGFDPARLPPQACPNYALWRRRIDAGGVTLVFADAYLNNPASMYGHTFLRLDKAGRSPLLSYAINYAADAWTTNGLLFAVLGLAGGFDGLFTTMPYYLKVQEYNNVESRDLWEYRLAITPAQLERLMAHAWELGATTFDYFFLSENCSYMLLTLLDAMQPELRLADDFSGFVIPTDTLRSVLARPGLVVDRTWRPAHRSQLIGLRDGLDADERDLAERVADTANPTLASGLEPLRQARVLDTARALMRWRHGYVRDGDEGFVAAERAVLTARARLRVRLDEPDLAPRAAPPEAGHPSSRVRMGGGYGQRGPLTRLQVRFALHDLLDDQTAYPEGTQLAKGDVRFRWNPSDAHGTQRPFLEQLDIVEILSLTPSERWLVQPAWRARLAVDQAADLGCSGWSCLTLDGRLGGGLAVGAGPLSPLYALGQLHLRAFGPLESYGLVGAGGLMGARFTAGRWRLLAEGEVGYDLLGHERGLKWTARLGQSVVLSPTWAVRLDGLLGNGDRREGALSALYYY